MPAVRLLVILLAAVLPEFAYSQGVVVPPELNDFPSSTFRDYERALPKAPGGAGTPGGRAHEPGASIKCAFTPPPLKVRAVYTGVYRPIRKDQRVFEDICSKSFDGATRRFFKAFRTEVLVREGDLERWIPVQSTFVKALKKEGREGETVELYLRYFGLLDYSPRYYMIDFDASPGASE